MVHSRPGEWEEVAHPAAQSHNCQVVVVVGSHIVLGMEVNSLDAELLLVNILNILVTVPHPHHVGLPWVILQAVGGSEEVAAGDDDGSAPVECPASYPDWRENFYSS